VAVVAVVVAVAVVALGGSSGNDSNNSPVTVSTIATSGKKTTTAKTAHKTAAPKHSSSTLAPAETVVTVLNSTEITGLAHRVAIALQQSGYSQAGALTGRPPGSGQVSSVQYASGHQAEAEAVAHSLSIAQVQPLESTVAALANSAAVVVIVGEDESTKVP